jgi:hypothetical protein
MLLRDYLVRTKYGSRSFRDQTHILNGGTKNSPTSVREPYHKYLDRNA